MESIPLLWLTLSLGFTLGVSVSFLLAALQIKGRLYLLGALLVAAASIAYFRFDILWITPLNAFENPSPLTFLISLLPPAVFSAIGLYIFEMPEGNATSRSYSDRFSRLNARIGNGLVTKMLIDLTRSSGGIWKVFFSVGILFGVFVFMVETIPIVSNIVSSPGIAFAVLLALSSVSVYNWLNMFDRPSEYLVYPVDTEDVMRAKFVTHLFVSLPVSFLYLAVGGYLFGFDEIL
ncbi:MAG: hypothetical protein SXQ77_13050, partial [Halobacteria archaeon]|nr:hypothetical protein [Halobacteria archaeon]